MTLDTNAIRTDILQFLAETHPKLPIPTLGFLGGSRAATDKNLATRSSDYDVLLFFPEIDVPVSYTFWSDRMQRKYDLILRDAETFAHDIKQEVEITGRGTLLHLASYSQILFGNEEDAHRFRRYTTKLHQTGPYVLHPQDKKEIQGRHIQSIHRFQTQTTTADQHTLFSLALLNRLSSDLLRASPAWSAQGKIAFRFLTEFSASAGLGVHYVLQDTKTRLQQAFQMAANNQRYEGFNNLISGRLMTLYALAQSTGKQVSPARENIISFDIDDDFARAITNSRIDPDSMAFYRRQNASTQGAFAASTWAIIKVGVVTEAISRERFTSRKDEYLFALARGACTFTEICATIYSDHPNSLSLDERVHLAFDHHPEVGFRLKQALSGQPEPFVDLFKSLLDHFPTRAAKYLHRPSPGHFRTEPSPELAQALNLSTALRHPA